MLRSRRGAVDVGTITAVWPEADTLKILDQRQLPGAVEYLTCRSAAEVVAAIADLAVRGAPAIGVAGLYGLWVEAVRVSARPDARDRVLDAAVRLRHARPTAVNLAVAIDFGLEQLGTATGPEAVSRLRNAADTLAAEERARTHRQAQWGASLVSKTASLLTHCNTGSLAAVGMGTALGMIRALYAAGRLSQVWVDETRPLLQGARLTAWELAQDGIPARLVTDSMAGSLMVQGLVDAVVVGADRIAANGDTANKIGTYSLAVLAHYHQVPFYVVAPVTTIDPKTPDGHRIPIEERHPDEVRRVAGQLVAPAQFPVYNPAFDVTPAHLISAIVTDAGILRPPYAGAIAALFSKD